MSAQKGTRIPEEEEEDYDILDVGVMPARSDLFKVFTQSPDEPCETCEKGSDCDEQCAEEEECWEGLVNEEEEGFEEDVSVQMEEDEN